MGIGPFSRITTCSDSSHDYDGLLFRGYRDHPNTPQKSVPLGNPVPTRFTVVRTEQCGRFTVAEIHYPDCQNYEGNKILVFEGTSVAKVRKLRSIDPHFCERKEHISPIARFAPTKRGWSNAIVFCRNA